MIETVYFAGGCLWGVQHYIKSLPGVVFTEAGRANGKTNSLYSEYDGYAECVRTNFDNKKVSLWKLIDYFFEIIDPYSVNRQGNDFGKKYRTGIYSENIEHINVAKKYIKSRKDRDKIKVEVCKLSNYVRSADEHQDRLERCPEDYSYCHIPKDIMNKYRKK